MINAADRLSKRVRAAMGDHNNDDLPVTQCVINMRKEVVSLQDESEKLVEALVRVMYCNEVGFLPESVQQAVFDALANYRKGGGQ